MTVAENIWLTHEPLQFKFSVKRSEINVRTQELLNLFAGTFQPTLTPDAPIFNLPPGEKQIVEVLKAYSLNPRLIILDEATASLDSQQVNRLFDLVKDWKARGMAIVFVSHRMDEIFRIADRASVLRNGKTVATSAISATSERELVNQMIEGATRPREARVSTVDGSARILLKVENLKTNVVHGVSFQLRQGELLGLGGLQGQGQTDLLLAIFGAIPFSAGIVLDGKAVHFRHPREAMRQDIAFVPGDRASEGLLLIRSILENLQLPSWARYGTPLHMDHARQSAQKSADDLRLVMASLDASVNSLSGGNAQKVVLGKWLLRNPRLLLLNDPTKGVDVGTKSEFYALLSRLCQAGTAVIFYSSDDEELLGLCDRVLVLHDGAVRTELTGEFLNRANLVAASMGAAQ